MNVRKIDLHRFMAHDELSIELPEAGLVLVTGDNGVGKSSVIEGVSVALWGRTLRGTAPWRPKGKGSARVESYQGLSVERSTTGQSKRLTFTVNGNGEQYETATKAQAALERIVGPFDLWRRTHVFSSSDAAHFSLATDAERKRLLEGLLGIDWFDIALTVCRDDRRNASSSLAEHERRIVSLTERSVLLNEQVLSAADLLTSLPPRAADAASAAARIAEAEVAARAALGDRRGLEAQLKALGERVAVDRHRHQELRARHDQLVAGICPVCLQPTTAVLASLGQQLGQTQAAIAALRSSEAADRLLLEVQIQELSEERDAFMDRAAKLREQERDASARRAARDKATAMLALATARRDEASVALAALAAQTPSLHRDDAELRACEHILGVRGLRAHILGGALSGIEAVANAWLSRLAGPGLSLALTSYTAKKSGGVTDAIGLEVSGAGGGHGYRGASGGERRRIDIAIMLALAEVASAAHNQLRGTLFLDEVFDALDDDGISSVIQVLDDLTAERAVVVISHNESLAKRLRKRAALEVGIV